MLISVILLIAAGVYKNRVRDSKDQGVKNTATKLLIAASILFIIELTFLVLSMFYQHDYSLITLLFPIASFFFHKGGSLRTSGMNVGPRSQYFQPISHVGGTAPIKQT